MRSDRFSAHRWIAQVAGRKLGILAGLSAIQAAIAILAVCFALLMRAGIDCAVAGDSAGFVRVAAALVLLIVVQIALRGATRQISEHASASIENAFCSHAFSRIMLRPYQEASSYHTGALMSRLTSDVSAVTAGIVQFVPTVVSMGVRVSGALIAMFVIAAPLALLFVALGVVMGVASIGLRGWMKRLHRGVQDSQSAVRCYMQECLESQLVVRTFGCEEKVASAAQARMEDHKKARMRRVSASNVANTGLNVLMQCGYVASFIWGCWGLLAGTVSYGTLMAVVQLTGQIQSPFASMGGTFSLYSAMLASAERLQEVEGFSERASARESAIRGDSGEAVAVEDAHVDAQDSGFGAYDAEGLYKRMVSIEFEHVCFGYGDELVFDGACLSLGKGEICALRGGSGAGKSTLLKLLVSAYEPKSGRIYVRMQEGEVCASRVPCGFFAYVPQGNYLMSGTIKDVVGFAEQGDQSDLSRVRQACKVACADDFVSALPEGYDTVLGERGSGLSEGQMQRIAIARAVYSAAPVLILDEATSGLDEATERELLFRLRGLEDRTVVIATHRGGTLRWCDRVFEVSNGVVSERLSASE